MHPSHVSSILAELHSGSCGCHSDGRSLAHRAISQGYWWKNMKKDYEEVLKKCQPCQLFSSIPKQPVQSLSPISSPWLLLNGGLTADSSRRVEVFGHYDGLFFKMGEGRTTGHNNRSRRSSLCVEEYRHQVRLPLLHCLGQRITICRQRPNRAM